MRQIPAGGSISDHVADLLAEPDVESVYGRNVIGGCYSFAARLA